MGSRVKVSKEGKRKGRRQQAGTEIYLEFRMEGWGKGGEKGGTASLFRDDARARSGIFAGMSEK